MVVVRRPSCYVGQHYEVQMVAGSQTVTKCYYANGKRVAFRCDGAVYYVHGDNLGSAHKITDNTGAVKNSYLYYPWGGARDKQELAAYDYQFNGQRLIASAGMYYYGAGAYGRFYDPALARWTQADSVVPKPGDPQNWNKYSYGNNNPLKFADPTGHFVVLIGGMGTNNDYAQNLAAWRVVIETLGLDPTHETGERWAFFNWGNEPLASSGNVPLDVAAARLAQQIDGETDIKLIGHSRGGALGMEYSAEVAEGKLSVNPELKGVYSIDGALWEGNSAVNNPIADERYDKSRIPWRDRYANLPDRLRARGVDADVATFDNKADFPFTTHGRLPGTQGYEWRIKGEGDNPVEYWLNTHGVLQRDPVVATIIRVRQTIRK